MKAEALASDPDEPLEEAQYLFDPAEIRAASEPPPGTIRLIWIFLALIRKREISYASFARMWGLDEKTFQRDVAKLRKIGEQHGFALTRRRLGIVRLTSIDGVPDPRSTAPATAADVLRAVADALGELVQNDLSAFVDTSAAPSDPFVRLALPRPLGGTAVAKTFAALRAAWNRGARVRFGYPQRGRTGALEPRDIEPYLVTFVDGRYYLIGFDRRPKTNDWRQFALDRIVGPVATSGSFTRRTVPPRYRGDDAVGLFKTGPEREVTIALSSAIAEAVVARRWQRAQVVERGPGAGMTIRFSVSDLGEAVRWALGLGTEARVTAPPEAVDLARSIAAELASRYADSEEDAAAAPHSA